MTETLEEWWLSRPNAKTDVSTTISRVRQHEIKEFAQSYGVKPAFVYRELIEQGSLDGVVEKIEGDRAARDAKWEALI